MKINKVLFAFSSLSLILTGCGNDKKSSTNGNNDNTPEETMSATKAREIFDFALFSSCGMYYNAELSNYCVNPEARLSIAYKFKNSSYESGWYTYYQDGLKVEGPTMGRPERMYYEYNTGIPDEEGRIYGIQYEYDSSKQRYLTRNYKNGHQMNYSGGILDVVNDYINKVFKEENFDFHKDTGILKISYHDTRSFEYEIDVNNKRLNKLYWNSGYDERYYNFEYDTKEVIIPEIVRPSLDEVKVNTLNLLSDTRYGYLTFYSTMYVKSENYWRENKIEMGGEFNIRRTRTDTDLEGNVLASQVSYIYSPWSGDFEIYIESDQGILHIPKSYLSNPNLVNYLPSSSYYMHYFTNLDLSNMELVRDGVYHYEIQSGNISEIYDIEVTYDYYEYISGFSYQKYKGSELTEFEGWTISYLHTTDYVYLPEEYVEADDYSRNVISNFKNKPHRVVFCDMFASNPELKTVEFDFSIEGYKKYHIIENNGNDFYLVHDIGSNEYSRYNKPNNYAKQVISEAFYKEYGGDYVAYIEKNMEILNDINPETLRIYYIAIAYGTIGEEGSRIYFDTNSSGIDFNVYSDCNYLDPDMKQCLNYKINSITYTSKSIERINPIEIPVQ